MGAVEFCTYFLFPMTASSIGRNFESEYLAGFSLASLSGNITCISIMYGSLTACETLQPRSFGLKEYRDVGLTAVRAFVFCAMMLTPPVLILYDYLYEILLFLGQDPTAARLASSWIKIYLMGVPSIVTFRVLQRFLASQNIVLPCAFAAVVGLVLQPFLLNYMMQHFGYSGSAFALVGTQWLQVIFSFVIVNVTQSYLKETWPGIDIYFLKEAINWKGIYNYGKLGIGGVFSLSEWWFWEIICFIAGKFGIVPLCVHSIAYQLIPLSFMIPLGISVGLSIRLGVILTQDVNKAKKLALYTMILTMLLALFTCSGLYYYQEVVVSLFTADEEVIVGCSRIWWKVCIDIFFLYVLGINSGILRALGMQWQMASVIFAVLWCIALPVVIYLSIYKEGGLDVMWSIIPIAYMMYNIGLSLCYITADWSAVSVSIRKSVNVPKYDYIDENTYLL